MNKQEKILIIGAGINQMPIIQAAHDLGYYVITVSCAGDYPGFKLADEYAYYDIFAVDDIIAFAKEKKVQGVLSDQSDMIAPIVAKVAEALDLPTWGYENALDFTDKSRMRALYERIGLPVPKNTITTEIQQAEQFANEVGFPIVIKPADAFASRGVFIVHDADELNRCYPDSLSVSRAKKVIVEEYIDGPQFFCQGFIEDGEFTLYAFSDRYYYDIPNLAIPYTNAFPAKIDDELKLRMTEMFTKVIDATKPKFGHVWAEWIYEEKKDTLYIVETAIRGAGAYVTSHLLPAAYGVDSHPYLVQASMGKSKGEFAKLHFEHKAAAFYCFLLPEGKVVSAEGLDDVANIPGVVQTNLRPIHVGDDIPPIKDKSSRFGPMIIKGDTREELDNILEEIKRNIHIQVQTKNGLEGPIWD